MFNKLTYLKGTLNSAHSLITV